MYPCYLQIMEFPVSDSGFQENILTIFLELRCNASRFQAISDDINTHRRIRVYDLDSILGIKDAGPMFDFFTTQREFYLKTEGYWLLD